ncbi:alcohol dehydrogenase catalytic domain-containing protein [Salinigranum sp. GCM10025319]|uniref:alcohol dehydrogenase catalytic domain-containing protein n=1 Tax=Salinigranum sp. GCM10025319 TaxID=3252687 RepID=UPI003616C8BE
MRALVLDAEWDPRPDYDLSATERDERRATNSAQVWREPQLRVEDRDRPTPAADEVLVRVRYAGICGSDVSMTETDDAGYMHYSAYTRLPTVLGHEFSGEVVETGADADRFEAGEPVTAEVTDYCGRCRLCRQGFHGHCENFEQLGFTIDGALAEYVAVPEKLCWSVASLARAYDDEDDLFRAAATVEPSTISFYGLFGRAEGIWPGDYHVYHGIGPIGLTGMNVSRAAGAGTVIAFDPSAPRREIARDLGFEHVYDPTEVDPVEAIDDATDGEGSGRPRRDERGGRGDVSDHRRDAGRTGERRPHQQRRIGSRDRAQEVSGAERPAVRLGGTHRPAGVSTDDPADGRRSPRQPPDRHFDVRPRPRRRRRPAGRETDRRQGARPDELSGRGRSGEFGRERPGDGLK